MAQVKCFLLSIDCRLGIVLSLHEWSSQSAKHSIVVPLLLIGVTNPQNTCRLLLCVALRHSLLYCIPKRLFFFY